MCNPATVDSEAARILIDIASVGQDHVSGWWILGIRILEMLGLSGGYVGGYGKVPRQSDMLTTLCYVASTNQLPKAKACSDLYLRPPVEGYALLDYHKKEEIVERAYKYALERLQKFSEQHDMLGLVEMHGPQRTATRSTVMPMLGADRETSLKLEAVKGSTTLLSMRSRSCSWDDDADSLPNMISPTKLLREGTATSMIHATALKRRWRANPHCAIIPAPGTAFAFLQTRVPHCPSGLPSPQDKLPVRMP